MLKRQALILFIVALTIAGATLVSAGPNGLTGFVGSANAAHTPDAPPQKTTGPPAAPPPTKEERLVEAEQYAKKLLLLMDTDKNGRISKKEFISFMSAEFDRMDVNHDGELDVKELTGMRVKSFVGK